MKALLLILIWFAILNVNECHKKKTFDPDNWFTNGYGKPLSTSRRKLFPLQNFDPATQTYRTKLLKEIFVGVVPGAVTFFFLMFYLVYHYLLSTKKEIYLKEYSNRLKKLLTLCSTIITTTIFYDDETIYQCDPTSYPGNQIEIQLLRGDIISLISLEQQCDYYINKNDVTILVDKHTVCNHFLIEYNFFAAVFLSLSIALFGSSIIQISLSHIFSEDDECDTQTSIPNYTNKKGVLETSSSSENNELLKNQIDELDQNDLLCENLKITPNSSLKETDSEYEDVLDNEYLTGEEFEEYSEEDDLKELEDDSKKQNYKIQKKKFTNSTDMKFISTVEIGISDFFFSENETNSQELEDSEHEKKDISTEPDFFQGGK
ncbi:hypothetical protein M0812_00518 [Anaeramoeba flamelloides]|uniref:Brl1/Brr6 domain-containing protein n=1 Tax=Anaeramoeba flamelloides TaxID=1746091 RepID=A0AAV8A7R5_9EUKA|nr:hypothetical protein M0812_00518 [Anaeramoeba flamelloides]